MHSEIRWPQVLFQKQVIAKSLFLDLLTREAGKALRMAVNLSKEPLFDSQTGFSPKIRDGQAHFIGLTQTISLQSSLLGGQPIPDDRWDGSLTHR